MVIRCRKYVTTKYLLRACALGFVLVLLKVIVAKLIIKGQVAFESPSQDLSWWQTTIVYQVYPRSFQDSNGDGIGDIKGIITRLQHFKYLGIETIWLSPVYKSPMRDFGYDVSDFKDIDPIFGTLEDFDQLVKEIHKNGMKIMMDFIPNHTSDLHPWFIESQKGGRDNTYADFYVWHGGKLLRNGTRAPPNNWMSMFGGSAWTWNEKRQKYFYHQYDPRQPDVNWRNPRVQQEMLDVFEFWLDHGVDAFRIDAIDKLYEIDNLSLDEPRSDKKNLPRMDHRRLKHIYVRNHPEIHERIRDWRTFFTAYEKKHRRPHIYMVSEMYDKTFKHSMKYYNSGADQPFNFNFMSVRKDTRGREIYDMVRQWLDNMPAGKWPDWVLGNHDQKRISNRKGKPFVDIFNILLLMLPGTPTTYQGEEIGMRDIKVTFEKTQDPKGKRFGKDNYQKYTRDGSRAPMQWSSERNAGFSTANDTVNTWLPIHSDYIKRNVQTQKEHSSGVTTLQLYRKLSQLRQQPSLQRGQMRYSVVNNHIFSFVRYVQGDVPYLVALNFGTETSTDDYTWQIEDSEVTSVKGLVILHTANLADEIDMGKQIDLSAVRLKPGDGVVIELLFW